MRKMRTTTLNHHDFVGAIITGYYCPYGGAAGGRGGNRT